MTDRLTRAAQALVAKFQRQRPMRSGSLLITLFGDAIAPRGGAVALGSLIRLAEPFGIPERLVRTSVGRLANDRWIESRRAGRQSEYVLTEHGKARFAEATQRIYGEAPQSWDGHWTLLFLPAGPRARRETLREEMAWLGFGQISPGVLAHPSRTVADTRAQLDELQVSSRAVIMRAASEGPSSDQALLQEGWDLAELARAYQKFVATFEPIREVLNGRAPPWRSAERESQAMPRRSSDGESPAALRRPADDEDRAQSRPSGHGERKPTPRRSADAGSQRRADIPPDVAFLVRTLLIHEYRKIHLRDPLLPHSLLPKGWIGAQAYELCRDLYRTVFAAADQHIAAIAETLDGKLEPLSRDTFKRFGGLESPERAAR